MSTLEFLSFDPVAHEYDDSRSVPPEMQARMAERVRDVAALPPGSFLLDAGVGTGRFALPVAQTGVPVVGVDISTKMMARLHAKKAALELEQGRPLSLWTLRGDLRRLPFPDACFGAALIVHILHLIADWKGVLEEVQRVLVPGGPLLFAGTGGQNSPAREHYQHLARARNLLRKTIGAEREEILEHLAAQGAQITQVETGDLAWTVRRPLAETLEALRRKTWSSQWEMADSDNETLLAETEAWAREHYGDQNAVEESEGAFHLRAIRWR